MKFHRIGKDGPTEEQLAFLQTRKLQITTPIYGGKPEIEYYHSIIKLQNFCQVWGLTVSFDFTAQESLIQRARNTLAHRFMDESDNTHMMFIDADIGFEPEAPFELLLADQGVVGATYPRKEINWEFALAAHARGIPTEFIDHCATEHVFGDSHNKSVPLKRSELVQIDYLPTGFLCISRSALETYKASYPDEWYWQPGSKKTKKAHEFFPVAINKETRNLESEDYCFTRRINALGVKTYLAPWIDLIHVGRYAFRGNLFCATGKCIHGLEPKK
jgi:hypothetical protein